MIRKTFSFSKIENAKSISRILLDIIETQVVNTGTVQPVLLQCLHEKLQFLAVTLEDWNEVAELVTELENRVVNCIKGIGGVDDVEFAIVSVREWIALV